MIDKWELGLLMLIAGAMGWIVREISTWTRRQQP